MLNMYNIFLSWNRYIILSEEYDKIRRSLVFMAPASLASLLALDSENEDIS